MWVEIVKYLSLSSVLGFTVWMVKLLIEKFFTAGLETYKNKLQGQLKEFEYKLRKIDFEHQVKFSDLHKDRANVIKDVYGKLIEIEIKAKKAIQNPKDKIIEEIAEDIYSLSILFHKNEIFFIDETSKIFYHQMINYNELIVQLGIFESYGDNKTLISIDKSLVKEKSELRKYINKLVNENIFKVKIQLKDEFQKLIGTKNSGANRVDG